MLLFQEVGMKRRMQRRKRMHGPLLEEVCTWMSSWILMLLSTADSVWRISTLWSTTWTESWPNRSTSVSRGGDVEEKEEEMWRKMRESWGGGGDVEEEEEETWRRSDLPSLRLKSDWTVEQEEPVLLDSSCCKCMILIQSQFSVSVKDTLFL